MTTEVLYHALGVGDYAASRCWEKKGVFCLQMEAPSSCHCCPKCGRGHVIHRGTFDRTVHTPPIGTCRTQLFIKGPRLECRRSQQVLNAAIPKVVPHRQYIRYRPMRNSKVVVSDFNPGKPKLLLRGRLARFVTRDRPAAKFLGSATGSVCAVRERAIAKLLRGAGDSMAVFVAFRGSCPTAKFLGSVA